jgi:trans-aconitate 2-methyltransferase
VERICEPELMDDQLQAEAYAAADFAASDQALITGLAARFPKGPGPAILDLGCGPGNISFRLAAAWPRAQVWGLDGATAMLTIAERRRQEQRDLAPRLRFLQRLLPLAPVDPELPAAGFSSLVSNSLLHHLHDPQALWSSLRPWAAPGALLFLRDLRRPTDAASLRALVKRHAAQAPPLLRRDYARSLRAAFTPAEVRQQLDQAGLTTLQVTPLADRYLEVWGLMPHG